MTAVATAPVRDASRIASVIRLHFVNPRVVVVLPMIVLGAIFVINVAIWALIDAAAGSAADRADAARGFGWSGSSLFVFVYMAVVAVQAMNGSFRFAQGFGVTRRDYYLGSAAVFGLLSVGYTALLAVLGLIEQATGGWGLGGRMFTPYYFGTTWSQRLTVELCLLLLGFFTGTAYGAMYVRFRGTGVMVLSGAVVAAAIAGAVLIQALRAWGSVFAWIGANAPAGLAVWSLLLTAVFAVVGFLVLRRATPQA